MKYIGHKNDIQKIKNALDEYDNSSRSLEDIASQFRIPLSTLKYYRRKWVTVAEKPKHRGGSKEAIQVNIIPNQTTSNETLTLSEMKPYKQAVEKIIQPQISFDQSKYPTMTTKHGHVLVDLEAYIKKRSDEMDKKESDEVFKK